MEQMRRAARRSAGLLPFRLRDDRLEVMIAHMGGPIWASKDDGAWSIVKGEYEQGEEPLTAAQREFREETGAAPPSGELFELGEIRQASGKRITAWAIDGDFDAADVHSNTFTMEWPPRSGTLQRFPEIDRAEWCDLATARRKLVKGQVPFLDVLERRLRDAGSRSG